MLPSKNTTSDSHTVKRKSLVDLINDPTGRLGLGFYCHTPQDETQPYITEGDTAEISIENLNAYGINVGSVHGTNVGTGETKGYKYIRFTQKLSVVKKFKIECPATDEPYTYLLAPLLRVLKGERGPVNLPEEVQTKFKDINNAICESCITYLTRDGATNVQKLMAESLRVHPSWCLYFQTNTKEDYSIIFEVPSFDFALPFILDFKIELISLPAPGYLTKVLFKKKQDVAKHIDSAQEKIDVPVMKTINPPGVWSGEEINLPLIPFPVT